MGWYTNCNIGWGHAYGAKVVSLDHSLTDIRAGESFADALDSYTGIAFSLKEYEDIAIEFARSARNIKIWREHLSRKRVSETLFDTKVLPSRDLLTSPM